MDTGAFDVLHDTGNKDVFAITYSVNFDFLALQILINQNRMILGVSIDDVHELLDLFVIEGDLHALSTENVGRTNQYRITDTVSNFLRFFCGEYSSTSCSGDTGLLQDLIE